ncbi:hypothetical protein VTO42DRAFT_2471 [Malbranchea cinnamomea]
MRFQQLAAFSVAFTAASALPSSLRTRQGDQMMGERVDPNDPSVKEGGVQHSDDVQGNLNVIFSDDVVNIGTVTIDSIKERLTDVCSTKGQCFSNAFELEGQIHEPGLGGKTQTISVIVKPEGEYPTWIRNGLLDALIASVKAVIKCREVTTTPTCANPMAYCPSRPFTTTQCEVPRFWGVNYQHPDEAHAAPPNMSVELDMKVDHGGFCEDLTTAASAVGGAVSGVAGGIFQLIGLACKD